MNVLDNQYYCIIIERIKYKIEKRIKLKPYKKSLEAELLFNSFVIKIFTTL